MGKRKPSANRALKTLGKWRCWWCGAQDGARDSAGKRVYVRVAERDGQVVVLCGECRAA